MTKPSPDYSNVDIHELLKQRREVAILWCVEDVLSIRSDLSGDQAWEVLQECRDRHDCTVGFTWELIESVADDLFPSAETTQPTKTGGKS